MNDKLKKIILIFLIGFGTTAMYSLPYMKSIFYAPMKTSFNLTHEQLGNLLSIYGTVAVISYLPGGWLADRYSAKYLICFSLISSGLLGLFMSTLPKYDILCKIFFLFGLTTILTYHAAVIKVIRTLGNSNEQGRLFGLYEGAGGIAGVLISFIGLYILSKANYDKNNFKLVIMLYSIIAIVIGIILSLVIKENKTEKGQKIKVSDLILVLKMPKIWLISIIIFSAYTIFSSLTYFNPYMEDVLSIPMTIISFIAICRTYVIKFIASPLAGSIADKVGSVTKCLLSGFLILSIVQCIFLFTPNSSKFIYIILVNMLIFTIVIFAFRGVYFATVDEANIPMNLTGIAVGFISILGFSPDAFYYHLIGRLLDTYANRAYDYIFMISLGCSLLGIIASLLLLRIIKKEKML